MAQSCKHKKASFFLDLFFKDKGFPSFFIKITNSFFNSVVYTNKEVNNSDITASYSIYDMPDYFETTIEDFGYLKQLTAPLYQGFLIDLSSFKNLEDYLDNHLGKPRKSQLKRYKKRLDSCIQPMYKMYFGAIEKETYHSIFKTLKEITKRRFDEKEEWNFELPFLEHYEAMMYTMIQNKKASIAVIYDKEKPINITLNFMDNDIIFHWNSCYDIDYGMFNLGHVNMINHLDWAFKNGYKLFDMSRGDFFHKRKYINKSYLYTQQIIYNSKSISAVLKAQATISLLHLRFHMIKWLKKTNAHILYGRYVRLKFRKSPLGKEKRLQKQVELKTQNVQIPIPGNLKRIDLNKTDHAFLIKPRNEFLYRTKECVNHLDLFVESNDAKTYYMKGLKNSQKITVIN